MAVEDLFASISGITGIKAVEVTEAMSQAVVAVEVTATGTTLNIGDNVASIDLGYGSNHQVFMTNGTVKGIKRRRPLGEYVITIHDILSKAVDYFIAPDDPDQAYRASNISAEDLVGDMLELAGITNYVGSASGFTFGVQQNNDQNKILLVSSWNAIENINRITGFTTYAQPDGQVRFTSRKPYIVAGDATEYTFTVGDSGEILGIEYLRSDEKLRNRVVVYGPPGIRASASASSPYIPSGFFKTLVVAHELIDTTSQAQATADVNLTMFNRLTETVTLRAKGVPTIRARDIVAVTEPFTGLSSAMFVVFASTHAFSENGYEVQLELTR